MAKSFNTVIEKIKEQLPKDYAGRKEFLQEVDRIQYDTFEMNLGALNGVAMQYFPEPKEDWQISVRLLAQNGEL